MQYVKSVSGTWHVFGDYLKSSKDVGGMMAQTQCDRLVKVARLSNTKPGGRNWCCECWWTEP